MSHVSTVDVEIGEDLVSIKQACKELGLEFVEGQKTHKWYGRWVNDYAAQDAAYRNGIKTEDYGKCEHAIRVPGASYEIGVARRADGKLTLVYDNWQGGMGIEKVLGKGIGALRREYTLQQSMRAALKKGYKVRREVNTVTQKPRLRVIVN